MIPGNTNGGAKKLFDTVGVLVGTVTFQKVRFLYIRIFPNIGQPLMKRDGEERIMGVSRNFGEIEMYFFNFIMGELMKFKLNALCAAVAVSVAAPAVVHANSSLNKLMNNSSNWAAQSGDFFNQRHTKLKQINKSNVNKLQMAWSFSTGVLRGHEGGPLVIGDTLYVHSAFPNKVFAINLADQTIKWKYEPKQDPSVIPVMCCDTVNRGVAYAEGKIFLQQADTTLVALNAKNGKVVWSTKNGNPKVGETNTNTPHVF